MTRARIENAIPAVLTVGFALSLPLTAIAQVGPGLSSGTGQGTGTGYSSGVQNNRTGSVSGVGPAVPGGRSPDYGRGPRGLIPPPSGFSVPMGPGVDTSFPDDPSLFPFVAHEEAPGRTPTEGSRVQPRELNFALAIVDPGDRALTLQRVANVAIFSNQLGLAHHALGEAAKSVFQVRDPLVRDLRLIALITALNNLSDAYIRDGKMDMSIPDMPELENAPAPLPKSKVNRGETIGRAEIEWSRAAYLAARIGNPTYRSEMLYRVIDSQAFGSQTVVNEFPHAEPSSSEAFVKRRTPDELDKRADKLLTGAAAMSRLIERPVWRDRALVSIATAAAQSRQYARGLEVARMIPQPEVRTDALVKLAETQARNNDNEGATATYREAAEAVASIPLEDPRAVLAGVLIDNLISVGRFEDARRVVILYPDTPRRVVALGAVAESQGFRGAVDSAVEWIRRDVSPEHQPFLYRRLRSGVLAAVEQNRTRDLSNRER
jgi:hypothetical protein